MASIVSQAVPLELLTTGERGIVVNVEGPPDFIVRLEEMGLHGGARVCMVRSGSPCILEINGQRFLIRIEDSATVLVDVIR